MKMISDDMIIKMIEDGALVLNGESYDSPFVINYWIVKKEYPQYLEFLIEQNLNTIEISFWREGFINFIVRNDGLLEWYITPKGKKEAQRLNDI